MNYIIIESQTTDATTAVLAPGVKSTFETAEQEYHSRLSFAAVSSVHLHAVTMLTENGKMVKYQCYDHRVPEEPTEPEEPVETTRGVAKEGSV